MSWVTYDYQCEFCDWGGDILQKRSEDSDKQFCPVCNHTTTRLLSAPALQKGEINITEFSKAHNVKPATVEDHMRVGYCKWPRVIYDGLNRRSHPLYGTWHNMKARCYNKSHKNYNDYGGRGIIVCDSWILDFWSFIRDMGDKPTPLHTIDRIDNDGQYGPDNCRWATRKEQSANKRELSSNNTTGYKNIIRHQDRWRVSLSIESKRKSRVVDTIQEGLMLIEQWRNG
jgi:putative FmdB family regulatory protein